MCHFLQEKFLPQRDRVPFLTRKVSASKKEIDCAILTRNTNADFKKSFWSQIEIVCNSLQEKHNLQTRFLSQLLQLL
jgi:hypothetical protein